MLGSTMRRKVGELGLDEDTDPVVNDPPCNSVCLLQPRCATRGLGWSKQNTVALPNSKALPKAFVATTPRYVPPFLLDGVTGRWRLR